MKLIDADAYAEEMKKRQDACKEWTQRTIDTADEENYLRSCGAYVVFVEAKLLLEKQPTIDAVEVVHGEWIELTDKNERKYSHICSNCHRFHIDEGEIGYYHYCPNCGTKMDGEKKHE